MNDGKIKLIQTIIKLLKNLNEFYQSIAQIIFALDEKKQKAKKENSHRHHFIGVPDDPLSHFSHIA